jgi:hypothetical protein
MAETSPLRTEEQLARTPCQPLDHTPISNGMLSVVFLRCDRLGFPLRCELLETPLQQLHVAGYRQAAYIPVAGTPPGQELVAGPESGVVVRVFAKQTGDERGFLRARWNSR